MSGIEFRNTPIGITSGIWEIMQWLLHGELDWVKVTRPPQLKCSNTDCRRDYASLALLSPLFSLEIRYPEKESSQNDTPPLNLLNAMREVPIVTSPVKEYIL